MQLLKTTLPNTLMVIAWGLCASVQAAEAPEGLGEGTHFISEPKPVLIDAVRDMSLSDAMGILRGDDTAATDYFRAETSDTLKQKFLPIIQDKMAGVGLYQQYNKLMDAYTALPLTKDTAFNLDNYVADKGLEGLFTMLAQEEQEIRANPTARTTELLQKVFASQ